MKIKTFENFEAFEKYTEKREIKTGEFVYIHENGRHNIDGEIKARSAQEAKRKLLAALAEIGLTCGYDDEIVNDLSKEGKDIMKIEIEELYNNLYYVNYIVSDFWAA